MKMLRLVWRLVVSPLLLLSYIFYWLMRFFTALAGYGDAYTNTPEAILKIFDALSVKSAGAALRAHPNDSSRPGKLMLFFALLWYSLWAAGIAWVAYKLWLFF